MILPSGPKKAMKKDTESGIRPPYSDGRSYRPQASRDRDDRGSSDSGRRLDRRDDRDRDILRGPRDLRDDRNGFRDRRDRDQRDQRDQRDKRDPILKRAPRDTGRTNPSNTQVGGSRVALPQSRRQRRSFLKVTRTSAVYERVNQVGEGTYGKVYKARNVVTGAFVALKRLRMESEKEGFPITAMREMRLLQSLENENIVSLMEIMVENRNIYMVFEYADHDLTGLLANPDIKLSEANCKDIFGQLCQGVSYLHSRRIIHRDIKGSNLLIDRQGTLKIADFGLARKMKTVNSRDYTNRVITLWYRPPELLLGTTDYGREVDMWGIGCLLIELFTKQALFQAQDELQQLHVIFEIMGTPTIEQWSNISELPWYELAKPKVFFESQFRSKLEDKLSKECLDLAEKLLAYNPRKRITAQNALRHPYFKENPRPEKMNSEMLAGEWHEFEAKKKRRKDREELKRKLEEEARSTHDTGDRQIYGDTATKDTSRENSVKSETLASAKTADSQSTSPVLFSKDFVKKESVIEPTEDEKNPGQELEQGGTSNDSVEAEKQSAVGNTEEN